MRFYEFFDRMASTVQPADRDKRTDMSPDAPVDNWTNLKYKPTPPVADGPGDKTPKRPGQEAMPTPIAVDTKGIKNNGPFTQYGPGVKAIVVHHTAGLRDAPPLINVNSALNTWRANGNSAHFIVDRDGTIYTVVPETLSANHVLSTGPQANNDITNGNSIGIEVSAADDSDVLPVQVTVATALISSLRSRYKIPAEMVAGHGQIWGQGRPRDEGMTIVNAVGGQYRQPVASNQNAMPKK